MTAQQLKNSILQMAVQGKLVPQDPNDEPASVLLERIRAEKAAMVKAGKIKKEKNPSVIFRGADNLPYEQVGKNESVCIADEVPFDIPDSWEWVRFSNICSVLNGDRGKNYPAKSTLSATGIPFISALNLDGKSVVVDDNLLCMSEKQYNRLGNGKLQKGDIVVCIRGSLGKHGRYPFDKGAIASSLVIARPYNDSDTLAEFVMLYLDSPLFFSEIRKYDNGTAQPNLAAKSFEQFYFPLPPLDEQKRILIMLAKLETTLDKYRKFEAEITRLNNEFPDQLKKSILQQAVQGKLVPQDENDEPASVLLERIRAEKQKLIKEGKIKRDKHESVIYRRDNSHYEKLDGIERCIDDEVPFNLPQSWQWCRLKEIANVVSARRVHQSDWRSEGIPFYRAREITKLAEFDSVNNELFISQEMYDEYSKNGVPQAGDLMVTAVGTLGKTYVVKNTDRFYYKDASVICFENFSKVNPYYLQLVMQAPFMESIIKDNSSGTTVGTITIIKANEYWIPLPPIREQERIVLEVKRLIAICGKL